MLKLEYENNGSLASSILENGAKDDQRFGYMLRIKEGTSRIQSFLKLKYSGEKWFASTQAFLPVHVWNCVTLTWSMTEGISLYFNGTLALSEKQPTMRSETAPYADTNIYFTTRCREEVFIVFPVVPAVVITDGLADSGLCS